MSISYIIAPSDHLQNNIKSTANGYKEKKHIKHIHYNLPHYLKRKTQKKREQGECEEKRLGITGESTTRHFTTRATILKDIRSQFPKN